MSALVLRGLTVRRGARSVLLALDLQLAPGERVGLEGGNGSGKSTLFAAIAGLIPIFSGEALLWGTQVSEPASRRGLGLLLDRALLPDAPAVGAHLHLCAALDGAPAPKERADAMLARTQLPANAPIGALSAGQRQLVGVALAFLAPPRLLLLDEPTSALDAPARALLAALLDEARGSGAGWLISSHVEADLDAWADRRVRLADGRLWENAP